MVVVGLTLISLLVAWVFLTTVRLRWANRLGEMLRLPSIERAETSRFAARAKDTLNRIASLEVPILVVMVLVFAAISVVEGTDRTYDLLNYHFANGFMALHPGYQDIGASGIQGFFNPLIDIPTYLGYRYLSASVVLFGFGLIQGLAFPLIYKIARNLDFGRLTSYFAAACGTFSAISMSEMGFSLGDTTLVPLVLLSLLLVIKATPVPTTKTPFVVAGILVAVSAALKLTTAPYLFGVLAFVLFYVVKGERIRSAALTVAGGVIGGLVSYGWWAWHLYRTYHNPFFPMFNQYFHSSYAVVGLNNGVDDRVHGLGQLLFFSYDIMIHPIRTGAGVLRDYGLPTVETLLIVALLSWAIRSLRTRRFQNVFRRRETRALVALYIATYLVWVETTGIFRYMAAIEMFSFLMIAVLVRDMFVTFDYERVVPYVTATIFVVISLTQLSPIWYPRSPAPSNQFTVALPTMLTQPKTSIIFADGSPNTWIVPFLPSNDFVARVFNWQITPVMAGLIQSRIAQTGNPVVVWTDLSAVSVVNTRLAKVNLQVDTKNCSTFQGTAGGITQTFAACRAITLGHG